MTRPSQLTPPTVNSPCVGVCNIDESTQRCSGCERTLDEIAQWGRMDDDARLAVWDKLRDRRQQSTHSQQGQ